MATTQKISLGNGSTVEMTRNEGVPDAIWNDVVKFVKENQKAVKANPQIVKLLSEHPEQVPMLMKFTNDSDSIKNFLQSQVLAANVSQDGQQEKMQQLQEDPELKPMFDDIKANGPDVLMKYLQDENIMRKVSQKLGGINPEMMKQLTAINESSVSLHDAAKRGDLQKMQEFLADGKDVNAKDFKGVTALGYAVGHDQLSVVKVLIDAKANINDVDSAGNSAVHFAAGYGRVKVLEHLLARGANASKANQQGQTPMAVAQQNKQQQAVALLQRHGAK
jgi:Fe-S cluster biosynthesis and repair protein YggX